MRETPCPICFAPYGFHDDEPHIKAALAVPANLTRPSNSEIRRQAKREEVTCDA